MSLRNDRVLSQVHRYALHRRYAGSEAARYQSLTAFIGFMSQFTEPQERNRMSAVYYTTLHGVLLEDRRTRGRRD
jgi:hypothetical protein